MSCALRRICRDYGLLCQLKRVFYGFITVLLRYHQIDLSLISNKKGESYEERSKEKLREVRELAVRVRSGRGLDAHLGAQQPDARLCGPERRDRDNHR